VPTAGDRVVRGAPAALDPERVLERLAAAVDFWILFSARLSRRPGPWIVLHRLLSVPLLLWVGRYRLELEHAGERIRVRCRVRFAQPVEAVLGAGRPVRAGEPDTREADHDLEVVQVHPWAAGLRRRRGWLTVPAFVRYRGPIDSVPPRRLSKSLRGRAAVASARGKAGAPIGTGQGPWPSRGAGRGSAPRSGYRRGMRGGGCAATVI